MHYYMQEDLATVIANLYLTSTYSSPLHGVIAPYDRRMSEIMNYVAERGIKRLVVSFDCLTTLHSNYDCSCFTADQAVHVVIHITQIWQHSM